MTFPVTIPVGSKILLLHSVTEFFAFFIGFRYYLWLHKQQGDVLASSTRTKLFIACLFGALLGSRLLGGLENPPAMMQSANRWLYFYQNKTVLGAFLGGLLVVEIVKKWIGEKRSSGDLYVYPLIVALIIGRIGCFSMGIYEETYGTPTNLRFGMYLGDNVPRHPVALYEIGFLFLLFAIIIFSGKYFSPANGAKFKIFLIGYLLFRFFLDFIKPHYTWPATGLSSIQTACFTGLVYYFLLLVIVKQPSTLSNA